MSNEEEILAKYQNQTQVVLATRNDGAFIIGEEVDDLNFLWYVVKNTNNILTLERAENQKVVYLLKRSR